MIGSLNTPAKLSPSWKSPRWAAPSPKKLTDDVIFLLQFERKGRPDRHRDIGTDQSRCPATRHARDRPCGAWWTCPVLVHSTLPKIPAICTRGGNTSDNERPTGAERRQSPGLADAGRSRHRWRWPPGPGCRGEARLHPRVPTIRKAGLRIRGSALAAGTSRGRSRGSSLSTYSIRS